MALTPPQAQALAERAPALEPLAGDLPAEPDPVRDCARAIVRELRRLVGFDPANRGMLAAGLEIFRRHGPAVPGLAQVTVETLVDAVVEQERQAHELAAWAARNPERAGVDDRVARREARRRRRTLARIRRGAVRAPVLRVPLRRPARTSRSRSPRARRSTCSGGRDDGDGGPGESDPDPVGALRGSRVERHALLPIGGGA